MFKKGAFACVCELVQQWEKPQSTSCLSLVVFYMIICSQLTATFDEKYIDH